VEEFIESVNIEALMKSKGTCFLEKTLYLTRQKLTQGEANHEKSHTGGKRLCATIWASLFLQCQPT